MEVSGRDGCCREGFKGGAVCLSDEGERAGGKGLHREARKRRERGQRRLGLWRGDREWKFPGPDHVANTNTLT